jgi:DNA (cytosine-5)-methyltransferase 1
MKKRFKFIDLFAGIGGFHIAMDENGGECVFASEIDKFARQTYEHNFKNKSPEIFKKGLFNEDITDLSLDYKDIPNFDVLCAGFPCQPFSHAGLKQGFEDKSRGTLFFKIQAIVRAKIEGNKTAKNVTIPKVLLLENVKGFRNHDKGNTFKVVKETLEDLGYKVQEEILNSKHFGVPQNRERIFIVAWHKESVLKDKFEFPFGIDNEGNVIKKKEMKKPQM